MVKVVTTSPPQSRSVSLIVSLLLASLLLFFAKVQAGNTPVHHQKPSPKKRKPHVVFLISEDSLNYEAHKTIPVFAQALRQQHDSRVTVLLGKGSNNAFHFPEMEVIRKADLIVLFSRRIAIPHHQMSLFKAYLKKGGPLVAIRTGNHAFTTRGTIEKGYEDWPEFVHEILGCENRGYGPVELGTDVTAPTESVNHPILKEWKPFHSIGNLYRVKPLHDPLATVLLWGKAGNEIEPVAWTRSAGKSRIFYTTLGYPTDFSEPSFLALLNNAIRWATDP